MTSFKFIDLFCGIGGFRTALDELGGECVLSSEIDKYASKAYGILYGEVPSGDITKIDEIDVPDHDILAGGFPCQAFSVSGKRQGFADTRGTLFFEAARIAKYKQPKVLFLENVKGLLTHDKGQTLTIMLETLSEIGYITDFSIMNSKYFGLAQNRERIFIVAVREDLVKEEAYIIPKEKKSLVVYRRKEEVNENDRIRTFNFAFPSQDRVVRKIRDILETNVDERYYLEEAKTKKLVDELNSKYPSIDPNEINTLGYADLKGHKGIRRVVDEGGICPTLDTMQGGNRQPKIAEEGIVLKGNVNGYQDGFVMGTEGISKTLLAGNSKKYILEDNLSTQEEQEIKCVNPRKDDGSQSYQQDRVYHNDGIVPALCSSLADLKVVEDEGIKLEGLLREGNSQANRVYNTTGISPTVNTSTPITITEEAELIKVGNVNPGGRGQSGEVHHEDGLAPTLCASDIKNILEEDEIVGLAINEATKKGYSIAEEGDTVNIQFPNSKTRRGRVGKQIANTIEASGVNQGVVMKNYRIRRLTPLECFRLQGFYDNYYYTLKDHDISNSQLYKMSGNAVSVPVIRAVGEEIVRLIERTDNEKGE